MPATSVPKSHFSSQFVRFAIRVQGEQQKFPRAPPEIALSALRPIRTPPLKQTDAAEGRPRTPSRFAGRHTMSATTHTEARVYAPPGVPVVQPGVHPSAPGAWTEQRATCFARDPEGNMRQRGTPRTTSRRSSRAGNGHALGLDSNRRLRASPSPRKGQTNYRALQRATLGYNAIQSDIPKAIHGLTKSISGRFTLSAVLVQQMKR